MGSVSMQSQASSRGERLSAFVDGELFGEEGYFGHGPIHHEKVLEVPFLEGKLR